MFAYSRNSIPSGVIVFYKGSIVNIPAGWHLCDGTNGTDDLRDKFIVCAGNSYNVDDVGGVASHNHTFTPIGHSHDYCEGTELAAGVGFDGVSSIENAPGTINSVDNRPPFLAKAFIQKL